MNRAISSKKDKKITLLIMQNHKFTEEMILLIS